MHLDIIYQEPQIGDIIVDLNYNYVGIVVSETPTGHPRYIYPNSIWDEETDTISGYEMEKTYCPSEFIKLDSIEAARAFMERAEIEDIYRIIEKLSEAKQSFEQ